MLVTFSFILEENCFHPNIKEKVVWFMRQAFWEVVKTLK